MAIEKLNAAVPTESALWPFYDAVLGGDARATTQALAALIAALLGSSGSATQYSSPSATGFSVTVSPPVEGGNVFLLLTPGATYAAGTILMPASPIDAQEVVVHCRQIVTTLTVGGNGKSIFGQPTTIAANGFFRMRYDAVSEAWCRIG